MKKIILVHFGHWFGEKDRLSYQCQIDAIAEFLQNPFVSIERLERLPTDCEIAACDAILFISLSFKNEAKKIRKLHDKHVFMVTGLVEKGDDAFGVIPIDKSIGWHEIAKRVRAVLCPSL